MTFKAILGQKKLRPIFTATFVLSFTLNLLYSPLCGVWTDIGFDKANLWQVYSIIFLPSVLLVFPYMRRAEKAGRFRPADRKMAGSATVGYAIYLVGANAQYELLLTSAARRFSSAPHLPTRYCRRLSPSRCPPAGQHGERRLQLLEHHRLIPSGGMLGGALSHVSPTLPESVRRCITDPVVFCRPAGGAGSRCVSYDMPVFQLEDPMRWRSEIPYAAVFQYAASLLIISPAPARAHATKPSAA